MNGRFALNSRQFFQNGPIGVSRRLAILIVALISLIRPLQADQFGLFTYVDRGTYIEITSYPSTATGDVVIPAVIVGKPVTVIGNNAFAYRNGLTSVAIPSSVTTIGNRAFSDCNGLTSIAIPSSVTSIGSTAFSYCKGLTSLTIPSSVVSIGDSAFEGCRGLTSVTLPSNITSIGYAWFRFCNSLTSVTIPSSVTSIGIVAFGNCSSLASIAIPAGVTSIGYEAFEYSGLASVTIPASVSSIGFEAFHECRMLSSILVDPANSNYSSQNGILFNKLQNLLIQCPGDFNGDYEIPSSVSSIANRAFGGCSKLNSIVVPASVSNIGDGAFEDCSGLTGVNIPSGVTQIRDFTFSNCGGLTSITIPSTVTSIGFVAFRGCSGLTNMTIPASVTSIALPIFQYCKNLTSIQVEAANPNYSDKHGVLFNKQQTSLLALPGGYHGSYSIPSTVTEFRYAFEGCGNLTSVTVAANVSAIPDLTFYGCGSLTSAIFQGAAPALGYNVFPKTTPGFHVYYFNGAAGFTSPNWQGYPSVNMGTVAAVKPWLVSNGFNYDASLQSDPNGDGVNLLMAYALNLNPNNNLAASVPHPVFSGNEMSLTYYAGNADVSYQVQSSSDLQSWSTNGVVISAPDPNKVRTATVGLGSSQRFLRLMVAR